MYRPCRTLEEFKSVVDASYLIGHVLKVLPVSRSMSTSDYLELMIIGIDHKTDKINLAGRWYTLKDLLNEYLIDTELKGKFKPLGVTDET